MTLFHGDEWDGITHGIFWAAAAVLFSLFGTAVVIALALLRDWWRA